MTKFEVITHADGLFTVEFRTGSVLMYAGGAASVDALFDSEEDAELIAARLNSKNWNIGETISASGHVLRAESFPSAAFVMPEFDLS